MKIKKNIFGIIVFAAIIVLAMISCWSPVGNTPGLKTVDIADIEGITPPVTGEIPVAIITENAQYSGTVTWEPDNSVFAPATHYTATITLTAKAGYTLEGVAVDFFDVKEALSVNNPANSGIVTVAFPSTGGTEDNPVIIELSDIEGVPVPITGGTPVASIEHSQYTGTVTWDPDDSVFVAATQYTATITLTAKPGFTLQGITTNFFSVDGSISTINHANSGVITVIFPSTAGTEDNPVTIDIAAIEGVTPPMTGGTPVTKITENTQYTGTVTWEPNHSTFAFATHYTATITLTAKTGFTLQGVAEDFFEVEDAISTSNSADSGVVTVVFPSTAGTITDPVTIEIFAIEGITAPATGETPVTHINENEEYSGTVEWSPVVSETFVSGTVYTATITLTAKAGYTFQGIPENFFKIAGVTSVSNPADSGVITAVFPPAAIVINIAAIQGITVPASGIGAVTAITETEQYTGTVEWSPIVAKTAQINVIMYDANANGWGTGGLKVFRNGTQVSVLLKPDVGTNAKAIGLAVTEGMVVDVYWVAGTNQQANSFIMYYVDAPPNPAFSNPSNWNGSNAIICQLLNTMNSINDNTLLSSFTVALPPGLFKSGNQYTATITLTPKPGYTLEGVDANFFTVAGATSANNLANSGVITAPFPRTTYALGETGPGGGKIFYYSEAGFTVQGYGNPGDAGYFASYTAHYLEAAPANMPSTTLSWASPGFENISIPDAKDPVGDPIGAGRKNTAAILAIDANAPAAKACVEYSNNGMTDWFLPSYQELLMLDNNSSYVGNMGSYQYWSSTEAMFNDSSASCYYFGFMSVGQGKIGVSRVRAIRAF